MKICLSCGHTNVKDEVICSKCGGLLIKEEKADFIFGTKDNQTGGDNVKA
jgi:uncharacterized membrane protein YvbJ